MDKSSKALLKGLLVVLTLALSKEFLLNMSEFDEMILISAMTALTLSFSGSQFVEPFRDIAGVKHNFDESLVADPILAKNTLATVQSTLSELTQKEADILDIMSNGLRNNEVAKKLGVSESTVWNYINSIVRKLNANLTTNSMFKAVKRGFSNAMNILDFNNYHKGSNCPYKPIICQEGWCSECIVYREKGTEYTTLFNIG